LIYSQLVTYRISYCTDQGASAGQSYKIETLAVDLVHII